MNKKAKISGMVLAIGAAAVFALTPVVATAKTAKVSCYGVNSCKGKGACKTSQNACKGQNTCKGKGFLKMTEKKCLKAGGTLEEPKASSSTSSDATTTQ